LKKIKHNVGFFRHKPNAYATKTASLRSLEAGFSITLLDRIIPHTVAPQQRCAALHPAYKCNLHGQKSMTSYFRTGKSPVKLLQDRKFGCKARSGQASTHVKLYQDKHQVCKAISGLKSYAVKLFQDKQICCKAILGLTYSPVKFFQDETPSVVPNYPPRGSFVPPPWFRTTPLVVHLYPLRGSELPPS
jgi:hypothetical protein